MAYLTIPVLVEIFGEREVSGLVDRAREGIIGQPDPSRIIERAESLVDAFVGDAYVLPIASPPGWLIGDCADIWRYYAYDQRATEQVIQRYNAAIARLMDISSGIQSIDGATLRTDSGPQILQPIDPLWPRGARGIV